MHKQHNLTSKILAMAVFSIGTIVLIGWLMDISILKSIKPGVVSMKANTALCFILGGFTLWLLNGEKQNSYKKTFTIVFPYIMILTGLLTLGEYIFEINLGIDEFLFKDEIIATATSSPGRMAPITAFCFVLSGTSLLLHYKSKAFQLFQLLNLTVFSLALLTLIGYAYVVSDFQGGMVGFTKMAIHTSLAFIFLSVGTLFSIPDKGIMSIYTNDGLAGITIRKLLPVIIFIPLITGWLRLIGQKKGYYDTEFGVALFSFITILTLVVVVFGISGNLLAIDKKRKEAEELLKEYKHFFYNSNDLCCIANMEGHFEIINPQFKKALGYSEKELFEKQFIEFIHPDDIDATLQEYEKQKSDSKVVINFVNRYQKKDGNYLWFDWNSTPNPVTGKIYAIARDITERKKAEQELEIITVKLKEAQSLAKMGNWENNLVTNRDTWSDETFKILGLDPATTTPSLATYLSCIHPNDLAFVKEKVNEASLTLKGNTFNYRVKRKDGTIIHAVSQSTVDINENNEPLRLFGIIQDITEIKNAEEKLIEINKELESFSYSVSHDLRAPLRAINGYAQILNEDYGKKLDKEGSRILETIRHNATKMGTLIDDLLTFSRLGRKEMMKTEVDMNKLTESVINEINKSMMHKAEINIAKLHRVKADYSLLHQVMFNLVSNAVKYSSKGENPVVIISSKEKNGEIVFSVNDNGAGFDMQYSDKLFGVFQRLHSHEEFEGTGVGLAIVQRIINKHGGKVWAEGIVNEGAAFNFSLTKN